MSDIAILVHNCRRSPDDRLARSVLADYLAEHGDPQGEFIRLALQADDELLAIRQRTQFADDAAAMLLGDPDGCLGVAFPRQAKNAVTIRTGLMEKVAVTDDIWLEMGDAIYGRQPVRDVWLLREPIIQVERRTQLSPGSSTIGFFATARWGKYAHSVQEDVSERTINNRPGRAAMKMEMAWTVILHQLSTKKLLERWWPGVTFTIFGSSFDFRVGGYVLDDLEVHEAWVSSAPDQWSEGKRTTHHSVDRNRDTSVPKIR